jgi:hypothetical protein
MDKFKELENIWKNVTGYEDTFLKEAALHVICDAHDTNIQSQIFQKALSLAVANDEILKIDEVIELFGTTKSKLFFYIKKLEIPHYQFYFNSVYYFQKNVLVEWIGNNPDKMKILNQRQKPGRK